MELAVSIDGHTPAERERLASELHAILQGLGRDVFVERHKESVETMEVGTILTVVLGSAAVRVVAGGIAAWLTKRQAASITIMKNGTVVGKNLTSADAVRIAELVARDNRNAVS